MQEKINITDIDKLHITRLKYQTIHFTYDRVKYMIVDDGEEDAHLSLYKRVPDECGKLKNILINGKITLMHAYSFTRDISKHKPKNSTYACLDKEYFIKKLVEVGFACGLYEDSYNDYKQKVDEIEECIKKLQAEKEQLKKKWNATSEHGSKTNNIKHKLKVAACERIKGAKAGEWCEEFKAPYGSKHEKYDGVLTDLYNLKYGTKFIVTNGKYLAQISYDEHGDKTVLTANSEVKLTKEHHSAYTDVYVDFNKLN